MSLRPYQQQAIDQIREHFASGTKKVMLHLATGAGKTHIFSHIIKAANKKEKRSIMVVRGRALVEQASQRLFREHVPHGVRMAKAWNKNYGSRVQVCSIDTLISRQHKEGWPKADIVVIDEAHMATSKGYHTLSEQYPDAYFLSVTATPYCDKPLRHVADVVVAPITMQELIDQGYLVPFKYFAPSNPDLEGVKVSSSTKDYVVEELASRMTGLTGDIVSHWQKLGQGRPTICFAVNIKHSKLIVEMFNSEGIESEHCDADTPDAERVEIVKRLVRGETKVVSNVGIFCTGVDIPPLGCIIQARPTKSYNLFIQQVGRGTRICPEIDKDNCILLDHAGNLLRHGFPTMEREVDLDGKKITEHAPPEAKICKECYAVYKGPKCPECGVTPPVRSLDIEMNDGELTEMKVDSRNPIDQHLDFLKEKAKRLGFKKGWVYKQLIDRFGKDECEPYLPGWFKGHRSAAATEMGFSNAWTPVVGK